MSSVYQPSETRYSERFWRKTIHTVSGTLGKPADEIKLIIDADCTMIWKCSSEPSVHVVLNHIGLGEENNAKHIKDINPFISEMLKIPLERITIHFFNVKPFEMGIGDKTGAEMMAAQMAKT